MLRSESETSAGTMMEVSRLGGSPARRMASIPPSSARITSGGAGSDARARSRCCCATTRHPPTPSASILAAAANREPPIVSEAFYPFAPFVSGMNLADRRLSLRTAAIGGAAAIRSLLAGRGGGIGAGITVDTANRLQGREYDVTIVLHPLSGRLDATAGAGWGHGRVPYFAVPRGRDPYVP